MNLSVIDFYFNIAFNSELDNVLASFLNNKELLDNGFEYLPEYDYYLKDKVEIDSDNPKFVLTIIDKEKYTNRFNTFKTKY
ncbi:hypothetical protein [Mariniflexile sp.]|uniref:hypothetical protein n=1 Tax=Mariniflexile sp. TaxID=1979402 RepID=UPI0040470A39